jgi:hypothetical protein
MSGRVSLAYVAVSASARLSRSAVPFLYLVRQALRALRRALALRPVSEVNGLPFTGINLNLRCEVYDANCPLNRRLDLTCRLDPWRLLSTPLDRRACRPGWLRDRQKSAIRSLAIARMGGAGTTLFGTRVKAGHPANWLRSVEADFEPQQIAMELGRAFHIANSDSWLISRVSFPNDDGRLNSD